MAPEETEGNAYSGTMHRSAYFFWMSVLLLGFVIVGFAPSLFLRPFSDLQSLPIHLHIHGIALTSWFVWFVVQTSMIQRGQVATHRRLGLIGAIIGATCVFAGPLATMGSVRSIRALGLDWKTDMSAHPVIGIEGIPMEQFAAQIVFGNIASILTFAGMFVVALLLRRNTASHKRLMLLATISIIGPALARLARWPALGGEDGPFIPLVILGLLISLFVYDYRTSRRIHRATWIGGPSIFVIFLSSQVIATSPFGLSVVRSMG